MEEFGQNHWVVIVSLIASLVLRYERILRPLWAMVSGQYLWAQRYMWIPPALVAAAGVLSDAASASDIYAFVQMLLTAVVLVVGFAMRPHDYEHPETPEDVATRNAQRLDS